MQDPGSPEQPEDCINSTAAPPVVPDSSSNNTAAPVANRADDGVNTSGLNNRVKSQPWLRQFTTVLRKNLILLQRRPITLSVMLFSSVISVLASGFIGSDVNFDQVILTECGTVDDNYYNSLDGNQWDQSFLSYNENWRNGVAAAVMTLGPMCHALTCFIVVHGEIQTQMLGVLRGLGLRESVYWLSWFSSFALSSFVNSLLGAITAALMPVHVFQNTYFGGIFAALFFLQLALVSSSLFMAALKGTSRRGVTWLMLMMLIAPWVPCLYISMTWGSLTVDSMIENYIWSSPAGLFWANGNTTKPVPIWDENSTITYEQCHDPIITEAQGKFFKTDEEKMQLTEDDWFVGCYEMAGMTSEVYSGANFGTVTLFFFPYFHFSTIFGNFLGYTGMPNRSFENKHSSMSPEDLAIASLPSPPNPANGLGSSLFEQGSTLKLHTFYNQDYSSDDLNKGNCPLSNMTDYFCDYFYDCLAAVDPAPSENSPCVFDMIGFLVCLCVFYLFAAAYWAQVFPGANGAPQKCYFFLLPAYWFGNKTKKTTEEEQNRGVVVSEIRKKYGTVEAVQGVSMTLEPGTITALLGHNGAGKTTLSHMICCETAASGGDISVYGYSSQHDAYSVRQLVGVCKQDDYLYPDLTAKEHLQLFGGLRGVPSSEIVETIQEWLESVDLAIVQNQYSSSFSGGMKRRLSVACSTIGDRPLIVLDEPTTGMDPISRRFVWRHLEAIRKGRVILLVSHAMDEAELLADSVAIMKKGSLAAFGSPLELKAQYGSALQFSILTPAESVETTTAAILEHFKEFKEWAVVGASASGAISVNIGKIQNENQAEGVSVETLAEFVDWLEDDKSGVSEYGFSNSSLEEVFLKVTETAEGEGGGEGGGEVVEANIGDANEEISEVTTSEISSFKPSLNVRSQVEALLTHSVKSTWTGKSSIGTWIWISLLVIGNIILGLYAPSMFSPTTAFVYETAALSILLITITSPLYLNRQYGLFYLMRTQGLMKRSYIFGYGIYAFLVSFLVGFVLLCIIYATLFREPTICTYDENEYGICDWKVGDPLQARPSTISWWYDDYQDQAVTLYAVPIPGGYGKVFAAGLVFAISVPGAMFSGAYLPGVKFALICLSVLSLVAGILPLVMFFLLPTMMQPDDYNLPHPCAVKVCANTAGFNISNIGDLSEGFLNCIGLELQQDNNFGSLCIPSVAGILPQLGLFQTLAATLFSGIRLTSDPPEYVEQVLVPALGDSVSCSGGTCKFPFAQSLYTQNIGFMIIGALLLLAIGYAQVILFAFPGPRVVKFKHLLFQVFARLVCKSEKTSRKETDADEVLEEVIKESEAVAATIKPLLRSHGPEAMEEGNGSQCIIANHDELVNDDLPPVLMYKLRKVYPSLGGAPPKVALAGLDLQVSRGEVLGLLGKNGAGKTTALKILSISHETSSGVALVAGFDVSCQEVQVFERLGNCPQFDLVWPGQSVQRHLEFFARLKGLPKTKVREIALSIATAVGLGSPEVYIRQAGGLSGGMRRRLSIAISLIGAPDVLLLDEPSTGLDPSTRNSIWNLIQSFSTPERSVVITTHAMLEADALCNRIAIVSQGHLKVVATQQHLKDKFGSGYLLQLNLIKSTAEHQEKAMAFVRNRLHEGATLQTKQAKTLHIALPRDLDLRGVFRALYSPESTSEGCINQFLLSQSSLEDVFIAIAE